MQGPSCLVERKRKGSQSITNTVTQLSSDEILGKWRRRRCSHAQLTDSLVTVNQPRMTVWQICCCSVYSTEQYP